MSDEWLKEALRVAADPPAPMDGPAVRQLARRRQRRNITAVGITALLVLVVGGIGVFNVASEPQLVARGADAAPELELSWMVEGEQLHRAPNPLVGPDERLIFVASTTGSGHLCLDEATEDGRWTRIFPVAGQSWTVEAGDHMPAVEDQVQAFRTDAGPGVRTYRLSLDEADPACLRPAAHSEASLEWLP